LNKKWFVVLALVLTVVSWSSAFVGIRVGLRGYDPGSLALFRYLIASACMVLLYFFHRHSQKLSRRELVALVINGIIGFGIYNWALNYGEVTVDSGIAGFLISQIPVFVTILAIVFLKEKVTRQAWIGMGVSFVGVSLIAIGHYQRVSSSIGIIYVLVAVLAGAIYAVTCKPLLKSCNPIMLTAYCIWFGTLSLLFYAPALYQEIPTAPLSATLATVYLGIVPAVIGYVSWSYVLQYLPASKASSYLYTMPILATLMGWLFIGEIPTWLSLLGGLIALVGAVLTNHRKKVPTLTACGNRCLKGG
jgi:drug/metabolite transporter (DMT)-like permease